MFCRTHAQLTSALLALVVTLAGCDDDDTSQGAGPGEAELCIPNTGDGATAARSAMAEQYEALGRRSEARAEAEAALRWNVPPQYAGPAHLVLARSEIAAGSIEAAKERLAALIQEPGTSPEAREAATALAKTLTK